MRNHQNPFASLGKFETPIGYNSVALILVIFSSLMVVLIAAFSAYGYTSRKAGIEATGYWPQPLAHKLDASTVAQCGSWKMDDLLPVASYWTAGTFWAHDEINRNWYSANLCTMDEGPLTRSPRGEIQVRFLWLRSFHPAISVRVHNSTSGTFLVAKEMSNVIGSRAARMARRSDLRLTESQWGDILNAMSEADYWQLPTKDAGPSGVDGATWIVEVSEYNRYHIVDRWSGGEVEPLGRLFLALAQMRPDQIY